MLIHAGNVVLLSRKDRWWNCDGFAEGVTKRIILSPICISSIVSIQSSRSALSMKSRNIFNGPKSMLDNEQESSSEPTNISS